MTLYELLQKVVDRRQQLVIDITTGPTKTWEDYLKKKSMIVAFDEVLQMPKEREKPSEGTTDGG